MGETFSEMMKDDVCIHQACVAKCMLQCFGHLNLLGRKSALTSDHLSRCDMRPLHALLFRLNIRVVELSFIVHQFFWWEVLPLAAHSSRNCAARAVYHLVL
jgi:hypothetical protein